MQNGSINARVRVAGDMNSQCLRFPALVFCCTVMLNVLAAQTTPVPHLEKQGQATQLIVDGKPFLILGGEIHNSSSSSLEYMRPEWAKLSAMSLNTVLTPVSWELIEPVEGKFDFTLVDGLLAQAREQHMRIVFLWLAAWKNGMSGYPPVWVKSNTKRFPRAVQHGNEVNILSTFASATREADGKAFAALMVHLREVDARDRTVLMVQVENEVGILGDTRDHSAVANQAFAASAPVELMRYLKAHHDALDPELRALWDENGDKPSGSWSQVFGETARADEIFMAWHYARYVHAVAADGKAAYNLPLYVNTWLGGEDTTPGDYPSGGPQPRVVDVWKAAGSALDFYAPDLYAANFASWAKRYHRDGNPLFLPETNGGAAGAANIFYALGEQAALGFCPFGIDSFADVNKELAPSYSALSQIAPMLLEQQSKGEVHGFVLDKGHPSVEFTLNGYTAHVSLDDIFGNHAENGFGLIMADGPDHFLGAGKGFRVRFAKPASKTPHVGIASVDEGRYEDGKWIAGRRLNGDENDQGSYWRFDQRQVNIEKVAVYKFE